MDSFFRKEMLSECCEEIAARQSLDRWELMLPKSFPNLRNARTAGLDVTQIYHVGGQNPRMCISQKRTETSGIGALDRNDTLSPFERT